MAVMDLVFSMMKKAWAQRKSNTIDYGIPLYYGFFTIGTKDDMYELRNLIKRKHLTIKDFNAIYNAIIPRTKQNTSRLDSCSAYNIKLDDEVFGLNRNPSSLANLTKVMKKKNVTTNDMLLMFKTVRHSC